MRMLFRSFIGLEKSSSLDFYKNEIKDEQDFTLDDLGKEIVYSDSIRMNSRCLLGCDHYHEKTLFAADGWRSKFAEWAEYMRSCSDIGCITFCDKDFKNKFILTDNVFMNAYSGLGNISSFFIIFNARPSRAIGGDQVLTVGYDKYSLVRDSDSIIVWNLDHFADVHLGGYTFWGIRHGTEHGYSHTDDELVGVRSDGREVFAIP